MKLTSILANTLMEITFYISRSEPVLRRPDNDSYIILNLNDFWALSTI